MIVHPSGTILVDIVDENNNFKEVPLSIPIISGITPPEKGGTGLDTLGSSNQILGINDGADAYEFKSIVSGTTGTDFNIAHSTGLVRLNLPSASASNRGALTSEDWITFNDKIDDADLELALIYMVTTTGNQNIAGEKTFEDDVIIEGNLTVQGTTTTLNTEQLLVEDNIVTLNSTVTGTPSLDAGLEVERGDLNNAQIIFDEGLDYWTAGISGSLEKVILTSDLAAYATDSDLTTLSGALQTNIDAKVAKAGDTMAGFLTLHADPTASGHAATKQYVDALVAGVDGGVPIGTVVDYAGTTAPIGWLMASGGEHSRTTFSGLFALIGTTYGSGDGSTTFNTPDYRRRVSIGKLSTDSLGANDGLGAGSRLLTHTHTVSGHYHGLGSGADLRTSSSGTHTTSITHDHGAFTSAGESGHTHSLSNHSHAGNTALSNSVAPNRDYLYYVGAGGNTALVGGSTVAGVNENVLQNHAHSFTTGGPDNNNTGSSTGHTHSIDVPNFSGNSSSDGSHSHTISGTIGKVTGGLDGNNDITTTTANNFNYIIMNRIIKY